MTVGETQQPLPKYFSSSALHTRTQSDLRLIKNREITHHLVRESAYRYHILSQPPHLMQSWQNSRRVREALTSSISENQQKITSRKYASYLLARLLSICFRAPAFVQFTALRKNIRHIKVFHLRGNGKTPAADNALWRSLLRSLISFEINPVSPLSVWIHPRSPLADQLW